MTEKQNSGEAPETSPLQGIPTDRGTTKGSLGNLVGTGSDNLQAAPQTTNCGQHQYEGQPPIIAPAARMSPANGEVQL